MDSLKLNDAAMGGVGQYLKWKREFLAAWQEGMMKGQLKQAFAMMPPELKEMLKQRDPQGYAQVMSMLGGE